MRAYADLYCDFTIADGTHNVVMYDLRLIPYTNVDCLGKNVVTGFVLDESENSESVSRGLSLFGLGISGATLMTDEGSAYPLAAEKAKMIHILCTQHFQQNVFASSGGMGEQSQQFKRGMMELIYGEFSSNIWGQKFREQYQIFASVQSAKKCMDKIERTKQKICYRFTGHLSLFTLVKRLTIWRRRFHL